LVVGSSPTQPNWISPPCILRETAPEAAKRPAAAVAAQEQIKQELRPAATEGSRFCSIFRHPRAHCACERALSGCFRTFGRAGSEWAYRDRVARSPQRYFFKIDYDHVVNLHGAKG
jgi:hypothetical protein